MKTLLLRVEVPIESLEALKPYCYAEASDAIDKAVKKKIDDVVYERLVDFAASGSMGDPVLDEREMNDLLSEGEIQELIEKNEPEKLS